MKLGPTLKKGRKEVFDEFIEMIEAGAGRWDFDLLKVKSECDSDLVRVISWECVEEGEFLEIDEEIEEEEDFERVISLVGKVSDVEREGWECDRDNDEVDVLEIVPSSEIVGVRTFVWVLVFDGVRMSLSVYDSFESEEEFDRVCSCERVRGEDSDEEGEADLDFVSVIVAVAGGTIFTDFTSIDSGV